MTCLHWGDCGYFCLVILVQHGIDCYCSFVPIVEQINLVMMKFGILFGFAP